MELAITPAEPQRERALEVEVQIALPRVSHRPMHLQRCSHRCVRRLRAGELGVAHPSLRCWTCS